MRLLLSKHQTKVLDSRLELTRPEIVGGKIARYLGLLRKTVQGCMNNLLLAKDISGVMLEDFPITNLDEDNTLQYNLIIVVLESGVMQSKALLPRQL